MRPFQLGFEVLQRRRKGKQHDSASQIPQSNYSYCRIRVVPAEMVEAVLLVVFLEIFRALTVLLLTIDPILFCFSPLILYACSRQCSVWVLRASVTDAWDDEVKF